MPTFVVSLARSNERREHMQSLLQHAGIPFEFFDAIDGTASEQFLHSDKAAPKLTFKRKGYHLVPAEIACFASHYALWEKCVALNVPILILEDNIEFCSDLHSILDTLADYIDKYQFIKLSATHPNRYKAKTVISESHSIGVYRKGTCGTTAYIVSPKAAHKLLKNATIFIEPVDDYIEKTWRHGVTVYHIYPSVIERSQLATTIGSTRKQKQPVSFSQKMYIEGYRAYESVMRKLSAPS
ncbi:glycosyltransferase [Photobacterium halotolerans]|uniref:Glycosyltransferase n=1 Tax=Photobacterium halotolerans TaxID=265726 RepID=A0A7X4WCQ3_9GAMM|nr:glycosyltransferase [Photobacterium halotolerans]NAW88242.1 glycosyltransferase [Photobacterium halotolerans]NAX46491.1 glycosyltransferase [Photobacterium halotolerans]